MAGDTGIFSLSTKKTTLTDAEMLSKLKFLIMRFQQIDTNRMAIKI